MDKNDIEKIEKRFREYLSRPENETLSIFFENSKNIPLEVKAMFCDTGLHLSDIVGLISHQIKSCYFNAKLINDGTGNVINFEILFIHLHMLLKEAIPYFKNIRDALKIEPQKLKLLGVHPDLPIILESICYNLEQIEVKFSDEDLHLIEYMKTSFAHLWPNSYFIDFHQGKIKTSRGKTFRPELRKIINDTLLKNGGNLGNIAKKFSRLVFDNLLVLESEVRKWADTRGTLVG